MAVLDGRKLAAARQEEIKARVDGLRARGVTPTIAPLLIEGNSAGEIYFRNKKLLADRLRLGFRGVMLPAGTDVTVLIKEIHRLNDDPAVHGIFVELPLPPGISVDAIGREIAPEKDIDALNPANLGRLLSGGARAASYAELAARSDLFLPATPRAVIELLIASGIDPAGKETVIVGGGTTGLALDMLILRWGYGNVTVCEHRGKALREIVPRGDIVIACAGVPRLITADMVREGAVVIDVGINATEDGIVGDVDFDSVREKAALITPVPGGVGPMTTTMIMENTVNAAERLCK